MKYYITAFIIFVIIGAGLFYCINNFINSTSEIQPLEAAILAEAEKEVIKELPPLDSLEKAFLDSMDYQIIDGYTEINWKTLSFVDFEEKYVDTLDQMIPFPIFKTAVKMFENEPVMIKGYTIPIEETGDESILVLSANPFASCFFCGGAGPETVMDIKLKEKLKDRIKQDDKVTFRGKLTLNDSDFYYLNYILENAELVEQ